MCTLSDGAVVKAGLGCEQGIQPARGLKGRTIKARSNPLCSTSAGQSIHILKEINMSKTQSAEGTDIDKARTAPGGAAVNRLASVATSAALGGAATGAVVGAVAGPVGAAVGAAVGAIAAGFAGNAIVDAVDADAERDYWRDNFSSRPYVEPDADFLDYGPAYGHGVDSFVANPDRSFDEVEADLAPRWPAARGSSNLEWGRARHASRDAWDRLNEAAQRRRTEALQAGKH